MDDHVRTEGRRSPAILLVYSDNHAVGEAAAEVLRAAGRETVRAESVYAAVVTLAAEPGRFAAAILAIDYFNREELRFFPMAKRRWPELVTAALTEPAFAYKAAIADLAGADFVCCEAGRAGELVEKITATAGFRPQASDFRNNSNNRPRNLGATGAPSPGPEGPPSPSRERDDEETATERRLGPGPTVQKKAGKVGPWPNLPVEKEEAVGERKRPGPRKEEAPVVRKPVSELPQKPARPPTTQEILTEEELAALMENMEEDDLPNE